MPVEAFPCGSRSTTNTRNPRSASAAPRLTAVVDLPTPPFWLAIAMMRAVPGASGTTGSGLAFGAGVGLDVDAVDEASLLEPEVREAEVPEEAFVTAGS
jgi:hypothetical protein